jgi:uncharacterized membrane protein YccC
LGQLRHARHGPPDTDTFILSRLGAVAIGIVLCGAAVIITAALVSQDSLALIAVVIVVALALGALWLIVLGEIGRKAVSAAREIFGDRKGKER